MICVVCGSIDWRRLLLASQVGVAAGRIVGISVCRRGPRAGSRRECFRPALEVCVIAASVPSRWWWRHGSPNENRPSAQVEKITSISVSWTWAK